MQLNYSLGVDAGNISVIDLDYVIECGGLFGDTAMDECRKVDVDPGVYKVDTYIKDCWVGKVKQSFNITTKGTLVFGDICYLFSSDEVDHDVWLSFLNETEYLQISNDRFHSVNTGGDGEFKVVFTLTKLQ